MACVSVNGLIASQRARIAEIEAMNVRLQKKPRDSFNLNLVRARLDALSEIWIEARNVHFQIINQEEENFDNYFENTFSRLQQVYEDLQEFLLDLLTELEVAYDATMPMAPLVTSSECELPDAKLPKLDLPKFSGEYEDWENFYDLFTSLVHNKSIADSAKLQYLKQCLTGTAADLVREVTITNANYAPTWQALRDRFYKPWLIIVNHLRSLVNLPYLKQESAAHLRSFADEAQRIVRALKNLKLPTEHWDTWFVFHLAERLDNESRKVWEAEVSANDRRAIAKTGTPDILDRIPKFADLAEFLEARAQTLIAVSNNSSCKNTVSPVVKPTSRRVYHVDSSRPYKTSIPKCAICTGSHQLHKCYKFQAKSVYDRRADVRRLRLCFNCFGPHKYNDCPSTGRCITCREKHHSLLHFEPPAQPGRSLQSLNSSKEPQTDEPNEPSNALIATASIVKPTRSIILATAQIVLIGPHGNNTLVRALLDQGSETSCVSESIAALLALPRRKAHVSLNGVGTSGMCTARYITHFTLQSLVDPTFKIDAEALVLPKLTSHLPSRRLMELDLALFNGITLADPQFYVPDSIDVLLGADVYGQLLQPGLRRLLPTSLTAQQTALGWVVSGPVLMGESRRAERVTAPIRTLHCISEDRIDEELQRFWRLEELPPPASKLSPEEERCESLFAETHVRGADGRYTVRLPLRSKPPAVAGETRYIALKSLSHMYRRFQHDPQLALAYRDFMSTYETLGHMQRVPALEIDNPQAWYLPHHAVVQDSPLDWKIRVVFDASRQIRAKQCLNDFLLPGPALQRDLSLILLNWRRYRFVFTADIIKMFRQINVASSDQDLQRILWAPYAEEQPIHYRLTTVTYGTACAPYLALRTLAQLTQDEKTRFPLGVSCLEFNTYVDDTFAGADDISVAIQTRQELTELLKSAGIGLDKWAANHPQLLTSPPGQPGHDRSKQIEPDKIVKTLGIQWSPPQDEFWFTTLDLKCMAEASTKRAILSNITRLFDPLGWLTPVTLEAKKLMQDLWIQKCGWDEPLTDDIHGRWHAYCMSLEALPLVSINRWFGATTGTTSQVHGFADASSRAYAAAVYIRMVDNNGNVSISLLIARSKVAPVKTKSIPNLELCGAALLTKLIQHVRKLDFLRNLPVCAWTDSKIVLMWLRKHPCYWKTFVANRVSLIQTELPNAKWAHVPTTENPADLATRGTTPNELASSDLWWHGPRWLRKSSEYWPQEVEASMSLHTHVAATAMLGEASPPEPELFARFSTLIKLIRVVAFCLRPLNMLRRRRAGLDALPEFLTAIELSNARSTIIKIAQESAFATEIALLQGHKSLTKRSPLNRLNPFVDPKDGILRVGGRLSHSDLCWARKHPPILPHRSAVSRLFVREAHLSSLHGGPTLTSNTLINRVWVLGRNRLVKTEVRNCVKCQRAKPRLAHQLMGELPADRVTPGRAFSSAGLDYAGPIQVRTTKGRGYKSYKGYIVLFVCFKTRAIHLDVVSDLTTKSFLAAFRRFIGRRGQCLNLYSDNATTFRGADEELRSMFKAASEFYVTCAASLANNGTSWTFIPPNAPHYGGLWEAGVKSVKHHLRRAIGDKTFTFEELSTVLVEIEACLNSRPLCPLSSDIEDLNVLTPSHFLIGGSSTVIPDAERPDIPEHRLDRFHLLQEIRNRFWRRWSSEYLQHLQEREKWRSPTENFVIGRLVLLRDGRYPPTKWPLARVIEIHPGPDGLVRTVTIRTATSNLRRHITRLCPLVLEQIPQQTTSA